MNVTRHAVFRGRVQGVGFRAFVEDTALAHKVEGWVRNRMNGSVEAVFAGPREAVDAVIAETRDGPGAARVEAVDQRDATAQELSMAGHGGFIVLPTV